MSFHGLNVEGIEFDKEIKFDGIYKKFDPLKKMKEIKGDMDLLINLWIFKHKLKKLVKIAEVLHNSI